MPEDIQPPEPPAPPPPPTPPPPPAPPEPPAAASDDGKDWKAEFEKLSRDARKWEDRAKANHQAAKQLEDLQRQQMTETEKAIADATAKAETEARTRYGGRLVDAEVKAAAAGRNVDVAALLEGLDRSRFLTDDGEPNTKAITAWVERIAPAARQNAFPDLGQGARGGPPAPSANAVMNSLLRRGRG